MSPELDEILDRAEMGWTLWLVFLVPLVFLVLIWMYSKRSNANSLLVGLIAIFVAAILFCLLAHFHAETANVSLFFSLDGELLDQWMRADRFWYRNIEISSGTFGLRLAPVTYVAAIGYSSSIWLLLCAVGKSNPTKPRESTSEISSQIDAPKNDPNPYRPPMDAED